MSAILSRGSTCVCGFRSLSIGKNTFVTSAQRPWCRQISTTIARRPSAMVVSRNSDRPCFRLVGSKTFPPQNPGNAPSKRRVAGAVFAAIASAACFDRFGTIDNSNNDNDRRGIKGPMVARMTKRRDTSLQIRFGDSVLVDHVEPRSSQTIAGANDDQIVLLLPEDAETISPFLYYLISHVKLVRVQQDGNRQHNLPIGLPGLGCAYCNCSTETASRSQVFPLDRRTFPNMVRKQLYNHIRRCQRCPLEVKLELKRLKNLEGGTRISREERLFFKELWFRMGHKAVI